MGTVLGLDPAWTESNPSGVALLDDVGDHWHCPGLAPSYDSFIALAHGVSVDWRANPVGGDPVPEPVLDAAATLAPGVDADVVAVDMPVSRASFTGRRRADDLASRILSGAGCGVHSPMPARPGRLSLKLRDGFAARGFQVGTTGPLGAGKRPLLEVYPHPAAMSLLGERYRLPYKIGRTTRYWPDEPLERRIANLLEVWTRLIDALSATIDGIDLPLPAIAQGATLSGMKRYEDALDALMCARVGTQFLEGRCALLGERDAAIWVPPVPGLDFGSYSTLYTA
jgi:predicted RNase H-like nuclease